MLSCSWLEFIRFISLNFSRGLTLMVPMFLFAISSTSMASGLMSSLVLKLSSFRISSPASSAASSLTQGCIKFLIRPPGWLLEEYKVVKGKGEFPIILTLLRRISSGEKGEENENFWEENQDLKTWG